ncbi:MAG: cytochrome b/b6 domain-containing protein [Betaproteobacteria bacterium]
MSRPASTVTASAGSHDYRRHAALVRITHWINVVALTILLMSGLGIFNAHPALYWGHSSYDGRPPLVAVDARVTGADELRGTTTIGSATFDTTGVLGASRDRDGEWSARGFPWWITIPDNLWLSMSRAWHFFFAWVLVLNGLAYLAYGLASRHFTRDVLPTRGDLAGIGASIRDHLRFRHAHGEAATRYNVLQKIAYLAIVFVILPLTVLMGLAMSPWLDGVWPGWVDLFGGRQAARTIHFACAWLIVAFVAIHVFQVIVTGLWNNLRSMISGRYRIDASAEEGPDAPR